MIEIHIPRTEKELIAGLPETYRMRESKDKDGLSHLVYLLSFSNGLFTLMWGPTGLDNRYNTKETFSHLSDARKRIEKIISEKKETFPSSSP